MKSDIQFLSNMYIVGGVVAIIVLILIAGGMRWRQGAAPNLRSKGTLILVYTRGGPVYMNQMHVRRLLEKISITLKRRPRQAASDSNLLAAMPLFPGRQNKQDKRELQQAILVKKALESLREFDNSNNIELRRSFCESRYHGDIGEPGTRRAILSDVADANFLRKITTEEAEDAEIEVLGSSLIAELEYIIYLLSRRPFHAVLDLRDVEGIVNIDIGAQAELLIRPIGLESPAFKRPVSEGFLSAYPQYKEIDEANEFGPRVLRNVELEKLPEDRVNEKAQDTAEAMSPVTDVLIGRYI